MFSSRRRLLACLWVSIFFTLSLATTASASFHSEAVHTEITGETSANWVLTTGAGNTTCTKASLTATAEASSFEAITATPSLTGCTTTTIFGTIAVTTNHNGCDWVITSGSFQLKCPEGKSLTITGPGCAITVPAQTFASGTTASNTGSGASRDIDLTLALTGISYSGTGAFCTKSGSGTTGTLSSGITVRGECPSGASVGVWSGEGEGGSKTCGSEANFHSEATHTQITGESTSNWVLTTGAGNTTCTKASLTATAEASSFEAITATPSLTGCTTTTIFGTIAVTTNHNGCDWVITTGSFQLKCPAGKSLSLTGPGCTITVPDQLFASGTTLSNTGSGASRDIDLAFALTGISYSGTGAFCTKTGSGATGTLSNGITVRGECASGASVGIWSGEGEGGSKDCSFHSEATHTQITGESTSSWILTTPAGTTTCKSGSFSATAEASSFETITATPTLEECSTKTIFGVTGVTANDNGCDWVLTIGSFQLKCPEGKSLSLTGAGCEINIPAQTVGSGTTFSSTGSGKSRDMDLNLALSGISYSATGGFCSKTGSGVTGTLTNTMTVRGECPAGGSIGIWTGIGEGKTICKFHSESEHALIFGEVTEFQLSTPSGSASCGAGSWGATTGKEFESITAETVSLTKCTMKIFEGKVWESVTKFNGCHLSLSFDTTKIICPAGKQVAFEGPSCVISVPPQELGRMTFTNEGSGSLRTINAQAYLSGVKYSAAGSNCVKTGEGTGSLLTTMRIIATNTIGVRIGIWSD